MDTTDPQDPPQDLDQEARTARRRIDERALVPLLGRLSRLKDAVATVEDETLQASQDLRLIWSELACVRAKLVEVLGQDQEELSLTSAFDRGFEGARAERAAKRGLTAPDEQRLGTGDGDASHSEQRAAYLAAHSRPVKDPSVRRIPGMTRAEVRRHVFIL